jgi:hypothetical protein
MANYDFNKDIEIGEDGEYVVRLDLESLGATFVSDNKNNSHDLIMSVPEKDDINFKIVSY